MRMWAWIEWTFLVSMLYISQLMYIYIYILLYIYIYILLYIYIYSGVAYIYVHKKSGHRESPIFFVQKNQNLSSEELINQYKSYSYVDDSGSEWLFLQFLKNMIWLIRWVIHFATPKHWTSIPVTSRWSWHYPWDLPQEKVWCQEHYEIIMDPLTVGIPACVLVSSPPKLRRKIIAISFSNLALEQFVQLFFW